MSAANLPAEIAEQPDVVERLLARRGGELARVGEVCRAAEVRSVLIAARGSSDNAARYAQHLLGRFCRLPVALAQPSLTTLYDASPRLERTLVIGISQSGESPDVVAVLADAREQRQPTLAITNAPDSPLARVADVALDVAAGVERSVAATKSYTATLAAVAALAAELCGGESLRGELATVANAMREQIAIGVHGGPAVLGGVERCAVAGRGANYATAYEAALKLKELTGIAAEPYSAADLMHGPVAVLGPATPLVAIAPAGPALASIGDAAEEARGRGAPCVAITDAPQAFAGASATIPLAPVAEWLSPLVAIIPAQLLAAEIAVARGVALDEPFGLAKVTRTT